MPRIARIIAAGHPYHIIQRGNNKQPIFFDDTDKVKYLYLLEKYSNECGCNIFAYCLMGNHVHILSVPNMELSLAKTMQKLSLTYTQFINQKYDRTGRLWECRYYSALIDEENYLLTVLRYIEQNPVRAKVVSRAVEYPWSSVQSTLYGKKSFVKSIHQKFGIDGKEYAKLLDQDLDDGRADAIRSSTLSGKPIGSEEFLKNISKTFGLELSSRGKGRPRRAENGMCP